MTEEAKTDEEKVQEAADKALVDEVADIDFTGDDPLKDPTEDSKTADEGDGDDKIVGDDKKSEEGSGDEKKEEEDTKTSEKKEGEEGSSDDKGTKPKEPKEGEKKVDVSQVDKLLVEIDRLSGLVEPEEETPPKKEGEEEKPKEEKVEGEEIDLSSYDFIKDIDMDDVSSDPKVLNRILHDVIKKVQLQTTEQVLRSIPQVVMSQVNQQTYFKRMADKFYEDNPDLVHVRQVVKACTQQVQQTNPEWEIEKVLKEAAVKTRTTLGMSARKIEDGDEVPPAEDAAFGKSKGGSKSNLKQRKSSLQTEIDEL